MSKWLGGLSCSQMIWGTIGIWLLDGCGVFVLIKFTKFPWWLVVIIGVLVAVIPVGIGVTIALNKTINME